MPNRLALIVATLISLATVPNATAQTSGGTLTPTQTATTIVDTFETMFGGPHPGRRAVHAKGVIVEGMFLPSKEAARLTRAVHFRIQVPVIVRFSNISGIPTLPDGAEGASPRGMAIKFALPDGGDTDIVAHSYNGFPAATPEEFLGFLRALSAVDPAVLQSYLATHPAARTFAATPKPAPSSYATERFFGVNAFRFTNLAGDVQVGRYRLEPAAGTDYLDDEDALRRAPDYLASELVRRLGQRQAEFRLLVQIAGPGDDIADGSSPWPADRPVIDTGIVRLTGVVSDGEAIERKLLFTPLNLVEGIAPSSDPMLVARNRAYRVSFERRQNDTGSPEPAPSGAKP